MRLPSEKLLVAGLGALGLFFLVAPMFVIVLASLDPGEFFEFPPRTISLHHYRELLGSESWVNAIKFTLTISTLTGITAIVVGGLAGVAVARCPPATRTALYFLLVAPLTIPTIAIAIAVYGVALRLHLVGNLTSFVLANSLITSPLVALFVAAATLNVDRRLEYASLSCGAGPIRTLTRITLPLILPTAVAGGSRFSPDPGRGGDFELPGRSRPHPARGEAVSSHPDRQHPGDHRGRNLSHLPLGAARRGPHPVPEGLGPQADHARGRARNERGGKWSRQIRIGIASGQGFIIVSLFPAPPPRSRVAAAVKRIGHAATVAK